MRNVKKNELYYDCFSKLKKDKKENNFSDFVKNKKENIDSIFNNMKIFGNLPSKQQSEIKKRYKKSKKSMFFLNLKSLFTKPENRLFNNCEKALKQSNSATIFDKLEFKKDNCSNTLIKFFSSSNLTNEAHSELYIEAPNKSKDIKADRKVPPISLKPLQKLKTKLIENDSLKNKFLLNSSRLGKSISPGDKDLQFRDSDSFRIRRKFSENFNLLSSRSISNIETNRKSESNNINNFNTTLYKECDKLSVNANKEIFKLVNRFPGKHKSKLFSQYIGDVKITAFEKQIFKEIFNRKNKGIKWSSMLSNNQTNENRHSNYSDKGKFNKMNEFSLKNNKENLGNLTGPSYKKDPKNRNNNTEHNWFKKFNEKSSILTDNMEYNSSIIRGKINNFNKKYKEILKVKTPSN